MRAKRTDANQIDIVKALRKAGFSVFVTSMVCYGFPDIVCGARGKNYLFEIKDGEKPKSQQKLTPAEHLFHITWQGSVHVITSTEDALDIINKV